MTEEELEQLTDEELHQLIKTYEFRINQLDISQYTKKLIINSCYGALTSKTSPIGDDDIGNSITLTGQASIKEVNEIVKRFIQEKDSSITPEEAEKHIIFNDTDSCGVSLHNVNNLTICSDGKVTKEGYELIAELNKYIDSELDKFVKANFRTKRSILSFKREKICDFGIYRKKKNYALHVIDDEGKVDAEGNLKTKWHYAGIELAKAIMTKELKEMGKRVIEPMILHQDKFETDRLLQEAYDDFKKLPLTTTCKLARVKTFDKYVKECDLFKTSKGMLQQARAAYYHNLVLKLEGIKGYQDIVQGDSIQILPVKTNNKYRIDCIAFRNGELPKEFLDLFEPDYKEIFRIPFYSCISSLYDVAGWPCKDPSDNYEGSLFDLF
jgi:DNA polymerase elongation subunit (family B)